ncbi:unnamed protein product [Orchesella dallaii]|uniref:Uncharacterized protein n=1 Tax=Orchesella dallaii TaxID=48710 RepID=A0ABP1Q9C2_9HEXA
MSVHPFKNRCLEYLCCCFGWKSQEMHPINDDDVPIAETVPLLSSTNRVRSESYGGGFTETVANSWSMNNSKKSKKKHHKKKRWNSSITPHSSHCSEPIPNVSSQKKLVIKTSNAVPLTSIENLYQKIVQETAASMIDISSSQPSNSNLCSSSSREYAYRVNHYQFTLRKASKSLIPSFKILLTDIDGKYSNPFDEGVPISTDDIQLMDDALNDILAAMEEFEVQNKDDIVVDFPMPADTILLLSNDNQTMDSL